MTCSSRTITNNLNLDMSWLLDKLFHIHGVITKGSCGFLSCRIPSFFKIFFFPDLAHSFSSTTCSSFKHYRVTNFFSRFHTVLKRVNKTFTSRNCWHSSQFHCSFSSSFIPHLFDHFWGSTNKFKVVFLTNFWKFCIFSQKPISWMYRVCIGNFRSSDNIRHF